MKSQILSLVAIYICSIILNPKESIAEDRLNSFYSDSTQTSILLQLDSLMHIAKSNGILIINKKIVKEWSYDKPKESKIESQSITKSIVSLLLGIALDEGKIKNIDDKVIKYYPTFKVGPHSDNITFRHLVTISSGISATKYKENYGDPNNMPPGKDARYHNDHFHQLALVLTYIFEKQLVDILDDRILSKLNATVEWKTDGEVTLKNGKVIPINAGYAFTRWNYNDIAKIGQLYINKGKWENKQLISAEYIKSTLTPIDIPLMISRPNQKVKVDENNTYGYGWRGIKLPNNDILWHMSGNGGQFCAIIPEKNIVFVKLNGHSNSYRPFRGLTFFKDLLLRL